MLRACALAFLLLAATAQAGPANDVLHWWTSPGEVAAKQALADAYRAPPADMRCNSTASTRRARAAATSWS